MTPLSCIAIFVDLITNRSDIAPSEKINILRQIQASAKFIQLKMSDMLDLTILSSAQIQTSSDHFVARNVLMEIIQLVKFQSPNRNVAINTDFRQLMERRIIGDKSRLSQVFLNLMTNAMKHSPEESVIRVSASSQVLPADKSVPEVMLSVIVQDEGPGIAPEDQERIWEPFVLIERSRRMNPQGVGLGLTLCKIICENQGGDIAVFSDGQSGTTFEFRFKVKHSYQGHDVD